MFEQTLKIKGNEIKTIETIDKLKKALTKLNSCLTENRGLQEYQERLHRISKTISSIEAHSDCYVTNFSLEDECRLPTMDELYQQHMTYQSEYITVNMNRIEFTEGDFSCNLDELLQFMEDELLLSNASNINVNELDSSDDEENKIVKDITKQKNSQKMIKKKFFNIELKLKAFLKQQERNELLKNDNFDSFVENVKKKIPPTNIEIKQNPSFIKNFFDNCLTDVEVIKKKRMTMFGEGKKSLIDMSNSSDDKYVKSLISKPFAPTPTKKISNFGFDPINEENNEENKDSKRGSIYRSPFLYSEQGEYTGNDFIEDDILFSKEDIISENDNSDEYEEIEEEVEEEVEEES